MSARQKFLLLICLMLYSSIHKAHGTSLVGVSWIYRGNAQQNNTALTFNLYDTLNLICKASVSGAATQAIFSVSKGAIPTSMSYSAGVLSIGNVGTLIYSDVDGVQSGYENFVIFAGPYNAVTASTLYYDIRYVNVGTLRTTDSATYHCSAYYKEITSNTATATASTTPSGTGTGTPSATSTGTPVRRKRSVERKRRATSTIYFFTSGGLTVIVNTKSGQALSSRTFMNSYLTYCAAIMGASKLLF